MEKAKIFYENFNVKIPKSNPIIAFRFLQLYATKQFLFKIIDSADNWNYIEVDVGGNLDLATEILNFVNKDLDGNFISGNKKFAYKKFINRINSFFKDNLK